MMHAISLRTAITLAIFVMSGCVGELALTHGMKKAGAPAHLRIRDVTRFLGRAFCTGWFWVGVPLNCLSFYLLMVLLSWEPISFVIPASALSYVVGTLGAKYILKEDVNGLRWAGVFLVCIGVAIVAAG
jgi:drug/metabolite transporter (DMT)-like permease